VHFGGAPCADAAFGHLGMSMLHDDNLGMSMLHDRGLFRFADLFLFFYQSVSAVGNRSILGGEKLDIFVGNMSILQEGVVN
jgi:hypothetical protein